MAKRILVVDDGRDLCRRLMARAATRHVPVVIISASRDTEGIARECGAVGFLAKPFEMDDVLALARRHTGGAAT